MKLKDVIMTTLFSVVGFVIVFLGGMLVSLLGTLGPFVHSALGSLLCAPVFFVMCHKVHKRFTVLLFYSIHAVVYVVMGMAAMAPIPLAAGIAGELLLLPCECNYNDNKRIAISYIVSELIVAMHGAILLLILGTKGMAEHFPTMFTVEAAEQTRAFYFNPKNFAIIVAIQVVMSIIGALLGKYIYGKFFDKNDKEETLLK